MKIFFIGVLLTLVLTNSRAQTLNLELLTSMAESKTNLEIDTLKLCEVGVLDGIPYATSKDLEQQLELLELSDIKLTTFVDFSKSQIYCLICDYVLVIGTGKNQSRKHKKAQLNSIQANLKENLPKLVIKDYNCPNCRQLVVDGNLIEPFTAQELINQLKPRDIQFIVSYETANPELYGNNALNGLTEIFMK